MSSPYGLTRRQLEEAAEEEYRMERNWFSLSSLTERRRNALIVVSWGMTIAAVFLQALYQRSYLTGLDIALAAAVCILAGAIMIEIENALLGYFGAMMIGTAILYSLATLPAFLGALPTPADELLHVLWISIIFKAIFPFPFLVLLLASLVGSAIGDRYL